MSEFDFKTIKRNHSDKEIIYISTQDFLPEFGVKFSFDNWAFNLINIFDLKDGLDYLIISEEENNENDPSKRVIYISKDIAIRVCKLCESEKRNQIISYLEGLS